MKLQTIVTTGLITVAVGLSTLATSRATPAGDPGHRRVVAMQGTDIGEFRTIQLPDGAVDALCFDVDLVDLQTGRVVGTGTDCFLEIEEDGEALIVHSISIFQFPEGDLYTGSSVGVAPTSTSSYHTTHVTGYVPAPGENNIVQGTGRYRRATGSARLSGAVDMSKLESDGAITFNCLFVIELD